MYFKIRKKKFLSSKPLLFRIEKNHIRQGHRNKQKHWTIMRLIVSNQISKLKVYMSSEMSKAEDVTHVLYKFDVNLSSRPHSNY